MIDKIATTVIKVLLLVFFLALLVYLFQKAAGAGYSVFSDQAYEQGVNGKECIITITEGEDLLDIAKDLERGGIVKNAYLTAAAFRTMEGYDKIKPGEYILQSTMKPSEMMEKFTGEEDNPE